MTDNRVRQISKDAQNRRLHTLPVWARVRIKNAETALAAAQVALAEQRVAYLMTQVDQIGRERDAARALLREARSELRDDGTGYTRAILARIDAALKDTE